MRSNISKRAFEWITDRMVRVAKADPELSYTQLAKRFGLTPDVVSRILKQNGARETNQPKAGQ